VGAVEIRRGKFGSVGRGGAGEWQARLRETALQMHPILAVNSPGFRSRMAAESAVRIVSEASGRTAGLRFEKIPSSLWCFLVEKPCESIHISVVFGYNRAVPLRGEYPDHLGWKKAHSNESKVGPFF
jgi:hypothetical protein